MANRKTNGYTNRKRRFKQRQAEADDRQFKYDALTKAEKIALAKYRGGSKRELARLEKPLSNAR